MNRLAIFSVTPELFVSMAKATSPVTVEVIENRLPEDAEIIGVNYDHFRQCFDITLQSESFAEVADDGKVPCLTPTKFRQAVTP